MFKLFEIATKIARDRGVLGGLVVTVLVIAGGTGMLRPADSYSAVHQTTAYTARSLNATTTAHLHLVKAEGSQLFEEGAVFGTLRGSMQAELKTGAVFTGSFTTHTHGGSIKGHGSATPRKIIGFETPW